MDKIFDHAKRYVKIHAYLARFSNSTISKAGQGISRVNPCPLCGHLDCFTIYEKDDSFNCFSCGSAGDIVNLEKHMNGFETNLEAARSLNQKYPSIPSTDDPRDHRHLNADPVKKAPIVKGVMGPPGEPDQKLLNLRSLAAEFFHDRLLRNESALGYLIKVRKHSVAALSHFKIGVAGGDLIGHATENGYSVADLKEVGLVRERSRSYTCTIPSGVYVYPHMRAGSVLFFTIKDPAKKHKFQIKKQFAAPGWLCMNQDALEESSVIVVEGEDDLLSVADKGKKSNVIATIGNYNTFKILDYLKNNSAGKSYYLAFDNDEAGKRYTKKYLASILEGGGKAYVLSL